MSLEDQFEKAKKKLTPFFHGDNEIIVYTNDRNHGFSYDGQNFFTVFWHNSTFREKGSRYQTTPEVLHLLFRVYKDPDMTREQALQLGTDRLTAAYEKLK